MHLSEIDYLAINGDSFFHKNSVQAKMIAALLVLTVIIISKSLYILLFILTILTVALLLAKVPLLTIGHLAIYPVFFSLLFSLIKFQESITSGLIIILKAVTAAFTMIFIITTTPYVDVFAFLALFLPKVIVDIFFFTYRSIFILFSRAENMFKSIKLKGGYNPLRILLNFKNVAHMIGTLIVHSFEMGERMHKIYALRGYDGYIHVDIRWFPLRVNDIILISLTGLIFIGMVIPWSLW